MNVTLDGRLLQDRWTSAGSLQALVEEVRRAHLDGRVVVDLALNGETLLGETLAQRLTERVGDADHVELASDDPGILVGAALNECAARLDSAADAHEQVADALQSGRAVDGIRACADLLSVWQECQRTVQQSGSLLGNDLTTVALRSVSLGEHFAALAARLREVRDAFEARDFVLLADLLRYEMPDVCRRWGGLLRELAEQVGCADHCAST